MIEHEPVVARLGVLGVEGAGAAGSVQQDAGVVDHAPAACARPQLDGAHPAAFVQSRRQHEVAVDVGAAGGQTERRRHRHDAVRRPELPAAGRGRRGVVGWGALRRAGCRPAGEQGDLGVRQAPFVAKAAVVRGGLPGRHPSLGRGRGNPGRPLARVVVVRQAERTDAFGTVAADTVGIEDRGDVAVECHPIAGLFARFGAPLRGAGRGGKDARGDERRRGDSQDDRSVPGPAGASHRIGRSGCRCR